jgi:manganese oxidase
MDPCNKTGPAAGPGRRYPVSAKAHIVAAAALVGILGAAAGPAYAAFDIPTCSAISGGGACGPSPLGAATPFTQQILLFSEFGPEDITAAPVAHGPYPTPDQQTPAGQGCGGPTLTTAQDLASSWNTQLDAFLNLGASSLPSRTADTTDPNLWASIINTCVPGLPQPFTGVAEGRPPGEDFAHQRFNEFTPDAASHATFYATAQAGSRVNGGFRDARQLHHYAFGEFAPGGLYHNTVGPAGGVGPVNPAFDGSTRGIAIKFHPTLPTQDPQHLWTFDGTLPPKLLMAPYGTTILMRHYNALPIDDAANGGFGTHTITTHEHNGHNPAESDGFAGAFFFPGEFYDYRWPMVLAGHDSIPIGSADPVLAEKNSKAGTPVCHDPRPGLCVAPGTSTPAAGQIKKVPGDWHETMSTHWFHDHMVDFTAQNVYKGNAVMMNYYSAIDRGREPASVAEANGSAANPGYGCNYADPTGVNPNNINLCFPSGSDLDWGNRSYDVNLVMADKAWDANGQMFMNIFQTDGFLGDVATVNFLYKPYLDVRARKYRFRILNGSVSRYWKVALVHQVAGAGGTYAGPPGSNVSYNQVPFYYVANDGNLLEHAVPFPNVQSLEGLQEQGIAERNDIIVNFAGTDGQVPINPGDKLYFVNMLEHQDGKTPTRAIPLAAILDGTYSAGGCPASCDPVVGPFMELRVQTYAGTDLSMDPSQYVEGKKTMIPLPGFSPTELANATNRTFEFTRGGDVKPWTIKTDGDGAFNMDVRRVSAAPTRGSVEIWHIRNGGQGWSHPVHVHFEEGQILMRGGVAPPLWEKGARKDMYRIGPLSDSTASVDMAIRVREFLGTYVEHCHNTQHEDNAMLLRWDSQDATPVLIQSPAPDWAGVAYNATCYQPDPNTPPTAGCATAGIQPVPTAKVGDVAAKANFPNTIAPPIANPDLATTPAATPVVIAVLDNDNCVGACVDNTLQVVGNPANGTAVVNPANGTVLYTPTGSAASDVFTYLVHDSFGQTSNTTTVSVTITGVPPPVVNPPVAVNDTATTPQDTPVAINVVANDTNCTPTTPCTVASASSPTAQGGTTVINSPSPGMVSYTPAAGFTGTDTFTYTPQNSAGAAAAPGTVTVTVTPPVVVVTDVVTIDAIRLTKKGRLTVRGHVSLLNGAFAPLVSFFNGPSVNGVCTGTLMGQDATNRQGRFNFRATGVTAGGTLCVQSSNGGVASVTVQ